MTRRELLALPPTVGLRDAAKLLGIGATVGYELAQRGEFPVRLIRLGQRYKVVVHGPDGLLAVLGVVEEQDAAAGGDEAPPVASTG